MMRLWVTWCPFSLSMLWHHMAPEHSQMWPHKLQTSWEHLGGVGGLLKKEGPFRIHSQNCSIPCPGGPRHTHITVLGYLWKLSLSTWQMATEWLWPAAVKGTEAGDVGAPPTVLTSQPVMNLSESWTHHPSTRISNLLGLWQLKTHVQCPSIWRRKDWLKSSFAPRDHALTH